MDRGLIVGAVAFAVAFAGERLVAGLSKDIARYVKMREMSGEDSIAKELLALAGGLIGNHGTSLQENVGGAGGLVAGLTDDIVRYARMKGM
jgi:hypothetical protein